MLYRNEPEKGLQPHQLAAFRAVKRGFREKRKASVIMPTGCGKSFVALQAMLDYKDDNILITVPTIVIKNQYYEYIAKYIAGEEPTAERTARMIAEEYFPNLKITTYTAIQRADPEIIKKLNPKLAITDEAHRSIAEQTEKKMQLLFDSNPETYWLGITATPERMDGKNVVDHFYEGTIDYELTLIEALREKIVKAPNYIPCAYALSDKLENVKKAIDECTDIKKKARLEEIYEQLRNIVANAEGIPELIKNNIQVKDGKVVVFCKNKEHMDELMSKVQEWFGQIDADPEVYSVYSGEGYTQVGNAETIEAFKSSASKHLKILFTVDMINEGFHIPVDTLIMARPTESRLVYNQQLGRGLSSDPDAEPTTVFDLVNNYLNFDIDRELNEGISSRGSSKGELDQDNPEDIEDYEENEDEYIPIDCFKVTGAIREFIDLLEEVNILVDENRYLRFAEEIYDWTIAHKKFPSNSLNVTKEERDLNSKYYRLKYRYIDKYLGLETEEERQAFKKGNPQIDEVIRLIDEVNRYDVPTQLKNATNILDWMKAHRYPVRPKARSSDSVEASLGIALSNLNKFVTNYLSMESDEEKQKFEQKHPEIFELISMLEEIKRINTPVPIIQASQIREWIESQPIPRKPVATKPEENLLARRFNTLKTYYVSKYRSLSTDEEKNMFIKQYPFITELIEIIDDIDTMCTKKSVALQNAEDIKAWMIDNKTTKRPSTVSKDTREAFLGEAYSSINKRIRSYNAITDENEKREYETSHPEIFEIIKIMEWIDEHTVSEALVNARAIRDWMESPEHGRFPKKQIKKDGTKKDGFEDSIDMQIEHGLAKQLNNLRSGTLKSFLCIDNPEDREKYIEKHSDILEVLAIINDLNLRFGSPKQRALAEIIHQDRDLHEKLEAALALEKEYQARTKRENKQEKSEQGVDIDGE